MAVLVASHPFFNKLVKCFCYTCGRFLQLICSSLAFSTLCPVRPNLFPPAGSYLLTFPVFFSDQHRLPSLFFLPRRHQPPWSFFRYTTNSPPTPWPIPPKEGNPTHPPPSYPPVMNRQALQVFWTPYSLENVCLPGTSVVSHKPPPPPICSPPPRLG